MGEEGLEELKEQQKMSTFFFILGRRKYPKLIT